MEYVDQLSSGYNQQITTGRRVVEESKNERGVNMAKQ